MPTVPRPISWSLQALMLAYTAVYAVEFYWNRGEWGWFFPDAFNHYARDGFAWLVFPALCATIWWLGFHSLSPELSGAESGGKAIDQRWARFLALVGLPFLAFHGCFVVATLLGGWHNWEVSILGPQFLVTFAWIPGVLLAFLPVCLFVAAGVCASETGGAGNAQPALKPSWAERLVAVLFPHQWPLGANVTVGLACVLVFASLLLPMTIDIPARGWAIATASSHWWVTHTYCGISTIAELLYLRLCSWAYRAGLVLAALSLVWFATPARNPLRMNRKIQASMAVTAYLLFQFIVVDVALFPFIEESALLETVELCIAAVYVALPVALWSRYGGKREWPWIRLALIVASLPLILSVFLTLMLTLGFVLFGYLSYFAGIGMLWWGYAQQLMAEPQTSVAD